MISHASDHSAEASVTPAWQFLSDMLVTRLDAAVNGRPKIDAPVDDDTSSVSDLGDEADPEPPIEPRREPVPKQGCSTPSTKPIPARRLLTCLRLAASFGSLDALLPLSAPGAISVLRDIDVPDLDSVTETLRNVLPDRGWRVLHPQVTDLAINKHCEDRFRRDLITMLDKAAPALILQPAGLSLPPHLSQPGISTFAFSPITSEILCAYLSIIRPKGLNIQDFPGMLPPEGVLNRLDTTAVCMALRAGSTAEIAARLWAAAGPQRQGPDLETGFSDSPAVLAARRMVSDLAAWRRGEIAWSEFSHSMLLFGPPGTGKTWLARAMGNSAGIACVTGSLAEWQAAGHLGDMLREMRKTFAKARRHAPAILFIDEIDAVGSRDSSDRQNENYRTQVINALLGEMNAIATDPGVIVVGACNHPDRIDPAVVRAGRFDLKVEMPMPDAAALFAVLKQAFPALTEEAELQRLARHCVGHSLASLDAAIRAARSEARHKRQPFDIAALRHELRLQADPAEEDVLWRIALHEAGHAVVLTDLGLGTIDRIAIWSTGGLVSCRPSTVHGVLSDMENQICRDLAGRAAEQLILGTVSSGAGGDATSDLAKATRTALAIETTLGLGARGPVWLPAPDMVMLRDESLMRKVRSVIETQEARATAILERNRAKLLGLAQVLLTKRSLDSTEIVEWASKAEWAEMD